MSSAKDKIIYGGEMTTTPSREYEELKAIPDWFKILSNRHFMPFTVGEKKWISVDDFTEHVRYRSDQDNPFGIYEHNPDDDEAPVRMLTGAEYMSNRRTRNAVIIALFAKFTQNNKARTTLLLTGNAKIYGEGEKRQRELETVRGCIRRFNPSPRVSMYSISDIDNFLGPKIERLNLNGASVWIIKNFLNENEISSKSWYDRIDQETNWSVFKVKIYGKLIDQPRLSSFIGEEEKTYSYSGIPRPPEKWTPAAYAIRGKIQRLVRRLIPEHKNFTSCLLNKYRSGMDKIGYHSDNEKDLDKDMTIASVSLGSTRDFILRNKKTKKRTVIPLKSGSLILMGPGCQENYKHTVPVRKREKKCRINLTYRVINQSM
jgi:alkylated DNA repair dioxygenase AlkB/predicted NAD-dependent protein-ADP-ribosyltransferase YbiA (DUF1768 family)